MSKSYNVNTEITAQKVRLLDEQGNQMGVMGIKAALNLADEEGLDLVEISPLADPPVCRMMDYGKFKYQEAKRAAEVRSKQRVVQTKEIKFRPMTDENDYQIKLRSLMRFLNDGDKAKVTLRFRGREMAHQEFGMRLMERVKDDLKDLGVVEQFPRLDGRQMAMVLAPQKSASKQS